MKVDWVPLGSIVEMNREPITLETDGIYRRIGIYSWGRGMLRREAASAADMGSMKYYTFPQPSLVFSNIQAWEGAVALASPEDAGYVCSSRFYPYVPRADTRVSLRYLLEFFRSEVGLSIMRKASPGTQVRNKVLGRNSLEASTVPLPPIADQERIAAHLGELEHRLSVTKFDPADLVDPAVAGWLDTLPSATLSELAEVCPRPLRVEPATAVDFVPMDAVDAATGAIVSPVTRARGELTSGYRQFLPGDVIFARITPCMQNGKSAIYRGNDATVGYGSTEFHVLRPYDELYAEWLWALLRTDWFISRAVRAFTGTAGQQRVPASFLESATIPVPPAGEVAAATQRLVQLRDRVNGLAAALHRRERLAKAILPAARNDIFNAMR